MPKIESMLSTLDDRAAKLDEQAQAGGDNNNLPPDNDANLTDTGNARRFIEQNGRDVRYVHEFRRWYVFDGHHWRADDSGELTRLAQRSMITIYSDAGQANHPKTAHKIAGHARRSLSLKSIMAALELAKAEPGITISQRILDANPMFIGVQNGVIDLTTGRLRDGEREDFITKKLPIDYNPAATCPRWTRFVSEIMGGNDDLINYLHRLCGYVLTGHVTEQVFAILYGSGANGKSVFMDTLLALSGDEYGCMGAPDLLLASRNSRHPTELADLRGARLVVSAETGEGRRLNENLVKQMTGGDVIKARYMRENFFEFKPEFKLLLATNHKPTVKGTDHAIWRRIHLVPFTQKFSKENRDDALKDKLLTELPGILNWSVAGCLEWQRIGLSPPEAVTSATDDYRKQMDVIADFLSECCVIKPNCDAIKKELYTAYTKWCDGNGETPLTQRQLSERMQERGFTENRTGYARKWQGVGLINLTHDVSDGKDVNISRAPLSDVSDANDANFSIEHTKSEQYMSKVKNNVINVTCVTDDDEGWEEF